MKNQSAFESDGSTQDTLLNENKEPLYRAYRAAYADLLSIWNLPVQQSEVMKIGTVTDRVDDMNASHYWNSTTETETSLQDPQGPITQTLDFQRHCTSCGHALQISIFNKHPLAPDTPSKRHQRKSSGRRCPNCKPRQPLPTKLPCVICREVVDGMLIPCLGCGHVSCFDCHREWFLRPGDKFDGSSDQDLKSLPSCPTGCGCQCSEHMVVNVPMPSWETPSPSPNPNPNRHPGDNASPSRHAHQKHSRRRQSEPTVADPPRRDLPKSRVGTGQLEDELDLWQETSPFASLARGLGGGLSRGLRTKEDRKKNKSVAMTPNVKRS